MHLDVLGAGKKHEVLRQLNTTDVVIVDQDWIDNLHLQIPYYRIDASTWEFMHLKAAAYVRCFIDMSLYNNFCWDMILHPELVQHIEHIVSLGQQYVVGDVGHFDP